MATPSSHFHPQLLLLPVILVLILAAAAEAQGGCRHKCGDIVIPFPFGIGPGCFRDGFEVLCDDSYDPARTFLPGMPAMPGDKTLLERLARGSSPAEGQPPPQDYACVSGNSFCANATLTGSYVCKCRDHYAGNPYVPNGCQDIDECKKPELYPCSNRGICKNKLGGYECPCKLQIKGDHERGNCTHVFSPAAKGTARMVQGHVGTWSRVHHISGYRKIRLGQVTPGIIEDLEKVGKGQNENHNKPIVVPEAVKRFLIALLVIIILSVVCCTLYYLISACMSLLSWTDGVMQFNYGDLARATQRFSRESMIGEGNFGSVYKATIEGEEVAVKKLKAEGKTKEFNSELQTISKTKHANLVMLKGWCGRIRPIDASSCWKRHIPVELLLVFEWIPNGSLGDHLRNSERVLPWDKRYKIVKGIGSALHYLHHECNPCILHRDIKPDNILLDNHFNAKLADFGLSMITHKNGATVSTYAKGSREYMDPQYMKYKRFNFNSKLDVYSFGLVLLEIACTGKREKVRQMYGGSAKQVQVDGVADDRLHDFNHTEMERVVVLGLKCCHAEEKQRPSMEDAMKFLEDGVELPATTEREGGYNAYCTVNEEAPIMPHGAVSSC